MNRPGSDVIEFIPSVDIANTYVRVHGDVNYPAGRWIVDKKVIEGKSAEEIKDLLALKHKPNYISDVKLPANDVLIRMGKPNRIFDAKGDLVPVQVEISNLDDLSTELRDSIFQNTREVR